MLNHPFSGVEQNAQVWCAVGLWHQNPIIASFWVRPSVENGNFPGSRKKSSQKKPSCIRIISDGWSAVRNIFR